ncbi:MAG TPA: WD40 repeat domain-containing protein [Gemmataceae bacterium]|jgi:WD40 repeat protein|nr:WD40 repeat domain-containing protein [Gemmataceae bacterium]
MSLPFARASSTILILAVSSVPGWGQISDGKPKLPEPVQQRFNEPQLAVCFSPDGQKVVCCGQNQAIRQWSLAGTERTSLKNAPGGWSICYSPDGKLIAGCGMDRSIRIWDAETGEEMRRLEGHAQTAWEARFLPDGESLVSVGEDGTIRFWTVKDGKEYGELTGHSGPVWCMAISPDGRLLATGAANGAIRIWDLTTGRPRRLCDGQHQGGVWPLLFSPDSRTLASGGWQDNKIFLWETATGKLRRQIPHQAGSKSFVFAPDGRTLITAGNDHVIRFWNLLDGSQLPALDGHKGVINAIAISPDGKTLASASGDCQMCVWNLSGRTLVMKPASSMANEKIDASWAALLGSDGVAAFQAIESLASSPEQSLKLIRERVQSPSAPDIQRISLLIADTHSNRYAVRQKATAELEQIGEEAEPQLIQAMVNPPSQETRRRAEVLLAKLETGKLTGETLRSVRALEVLERIGTPEARQIVQSIAAGPSEARLTIEAQATLKRMK